jgi:FixJ family two-component response regulator
MSVPGTSVALIDDDEVFREALSELLELSGLTVEQYGSGGGFLAAAQGSTAACLIVDVQLGDITGIEMAQQLAASGSRVPVIFITGSADATFERQAEELGCVAYLRKPFRRDRLIEAIMAATKLKSGTPEQEESGA